MNPENIQKVTNHIKFLEIGADEISPNMVADIAYGLGINLTREEVIHISDNFE